jgi:hypothetical protein
MNPQYSCTDKCLYTPPISNYVYFQLVVSELNIERHDLILCISCKEHMNSIKLHVSSSIHELVLC